MRPLDEAPDFLLELNRITKQKLEGLLAHLKPSKTLLTVPAQTTLLPATEDDVFYVLREGVLSYNVGGKRVFYFEEGDLVGLEHLSTNTSNASICTDFAVRVDQYELETLREFFTKDRKATQVWLEYLRSYLTLLQAFIATGARIEEQADPEIKSYSKGAVIIEEGTRGEEVFTMITGSAEASVKGVKVGEIKTDEIFGAIAVLTGAPRTATVRAMEDVLLLVLPKEKFYSLMHSRPNIVMKLIEDMARTIVSLNKQVVDFSIGYH